ncbi:ABC transporter ATP-binding protein/permease [Bartonella sp. HY329]|uniref:ABC transporter ATP-binding protein n=1 Tax=unclassified Bartonella TaxID=2645622 RepID=UPI0021CAAF78|nr:MULTISPECIES: ABC transporter ATP-binding protein [unclassified Bartonella]UXM95327.1 ABC transporter ATP-binding protein/permease [Bartonella sp. HY329]UXN09652.1 ABC transporter ATP-binding protein/permease [Bartonella sp. HY328]
MVKRTQKLSENDIKLIKRLLTENFRKHFYNYFLAIVAMLVIAAATSYSAYIMAPMVNGLIVDKNKGHVFMVAVFIACLFIVKGFATFFNSLYLAKAGNSVVAEQQKKVYARILSQGVSFFQKNPQADLLMMVTNFSQMARGVIDLLVTTYVRDLVSVVGLLAVMLYQNWLLTTVSLVVGPLAFLGVRVLTKKVKKIMAKEMASLTAIIQIMQETAVGIRVLKAFALEPKMQARMDSAISDVESRSNSIAFYSAATAPVMETLAGIAIAVVIAFSSVMVIDHGAKPGELMSFITALLLAYEPAKRVANTRVKLETMMIGVRMLYAVMDHPLTLTEAKDAKTLTASKGEVCFTDVKFAYPDGDDVLHGINLAIPAGKMTALVGPSGSGKSTMINLIMRLYDPTQGRITVDGQDIKDVTFTSLRDAMSYVGQDTFLFKGSVKHNISMGRPDASDEEIIAAAKDANAHEFIIKLRDGYDTDIGENGGNLSGGQRQRIAIARAMLRNARILILDEATSALDSESEASVQQALDRLTDGRTTIVIAHRLSTIANADQIVVMQHGNIIEQGTQGQLLAKENGVYARLHELQYRNGGIGSNESLEDLINESDDLSKIEEYRLTTADIDKERAEQDDLQEAPIGTRGGPAIQRG